jgi:Flp pilus assembly CpaE family ATPase
LTILLIEDSASFAALVKHWLATRTEILSVLIWTQSLKAGLQLLKQGGVDLILLDLGLPDSEGLETLTRTRVEAFGVPVVLMSTDSSDEFAIQMVKEGAEDYLYKGSCDGDVLAKAIRYALARNGGRRQNGEIVSFIGAKGGVGATTVALNVASVLARSGKVILVEMRPAFGTLRSYFRPDRQSRNISHLLRADAIEFDTAEINSALWPCKNAPGLSVLLGPQSASECGELTPERVKKLLKSLVRMADHVVLDLPASLSDSNRAAIEASGRLVLVLELDPVCVQLAKLMVQAINNWEDTPGIESVVVNRASVSCPMSLSEVETQLGYPLIGKVPPGSDVCLAAQTNSTPLVWFHPDSALADSMNTIAERCVTPLKMPVTA